MTSIERHAIAAASMPAPQGRPFIDPIIIDVEKPREIEARESLLNRAFGAARFRKTCQKLRAGRLPARGLSLVARVSGQSAAGIGDVVVGTVRLWHVDAGGAPALLLGPLAVDPCHRCHGIGARLVEEAIDRAKILGHDAILLVGDAGYYARFGFERRHALALRMPGPVEDARFLGLELTTGAFAAAKGMVRATGALDLSARRRARHARQRLPQAA